MPDFMTAPWDPFWSGPREGPDWLRYCDGHPAARLAGLEAVDSRSDRMTFRLEDAPVINPNGAVHGGMLASALDHTLGVAAMLPMPVGHLPNTTGLNVQYLRPALPALTITVRVTRGGRQLVFVRADVLDREDRLCATADGTFAVMTPDRIAARA